MSIPASEPPEVGARPPAGATLRGRADLLTDDEEAEGRPAAARAARSAGVDLSDAPLKSTQLWLKGGVHLLQGNSYGSVTGWWGF